MVGQTGNRSHVWGGVIYLPEVENMSLQRSAPPDLQSSQGRSAVPRRPRSPEEPRRVQHSPQHRVEHDMLYHDEIGGRWRLEIQAGLERGWDAEYGEGWELRREWAAMLPGPAKDLFYVRAQLFLLEERCGRIPGGPQMERPSLPKCDITRQELFGQLALFDMEKKGRADIEEKAATGCWGASVIRYVKANLPPGPDQQRGIAEAQLQLLRIMLGEPGPREPDPPRPECTALAQGL